MNGVFEIVIDGVSEKAVAEAMTAGIRAACMVNGVKFISAGNYGGTLGPLQVRAPETSLITFFQVIPRPRRYVSILLNNSLPIILLTIIPVTK